MTSRRGNAGRFDGGRRPPAGVIPQSRALTAPPLYDGGVTSLGTPQLEAIREALESANPALSPGEIDAAVRAVLRQHEDTEEHDRSLISERLSWSPDERLRALQSFLSFVERARDSREP